MFHAPENQTAEAPTRKAETQEEGQAMIGKCKYCDVEIIFIINTNGNSVPVDAKAQKRYVRTLSGEWKLVDCFRPHQATCPHYKDKGK